MTFIEAVGADPTTQSHRLEGRSLVALLDGRKPDDWRSFVFSEYVTRCSQRDRRTNLLPRDSRMFMIADRGWQYIHALGFRPMLFGTQADPELRGLGATRPSAPASIACYRNGVCGYLNASHALNGR
jgi:hypothetical protein